MQTLIILLALLFTSACTQHKMANHYGCSYETTEEAYENCMQVANGVDHETAHAAGEPINEKGTKSQAKE